MRIANLVLRRSWPQGHRGRFVSVIILLAGGIFIAYALVSNWNQLRTQGVELDYKYAVLALLLYPLGMLPTAAAWHTLLGSIGARKGFRVNLRIYSLSCLPRNVPGFVWFIASRSLLYQEQGVPASWIVASSVAETLLLAFTGFATATLLALSSNIPLVESMGTVRVAPLIAIAVLLAVVAGAPFLDRIVHRLLPGQKTIDRVPPVSRTGMAFVLVWMLLAWCGGGVLLFIAAHIVMTPSWSALPTFIGIWGAAGAVSLTVGVGIQGIGIREITLAALLSTIMPPFAAAILAILFRIILTAGELVWALFFAWLMGKSALGLRA